MKISDKQIERMAKLIVDALKKQNLVEFHVKEEKVLQKAVSVIKRDFEREAQLDREVLGMMDELERQHPGDFQRYKMFPLLKKKLAKEKGIIL
jgi:hypothetical protein